MAWETHEPWKLKLALRLLNETKPSMLRTFVGKGRPAINQHILATLILFMLVAFRQLTARYHGDTLNPHGSTTYS